MAFRNYSYVGLEINPQIIISSVAAETTPLNLTSLSILFQTQPQS